ncbi:hypothetical protein GO001_28320 [Streptomyces sp. NRRL B-1677]|uniref:Uncharacterized protein n=1 Tax=Streptomyces klenkii TaxID=1420899 RepID=A0A3B0BQP6_9ACTN|nr:MULTISPECIES: hypothetical protein [Streptomyces]MBF6049056.1 hypothetical protein [Streptomyces sp. NRRL B-1677]RKN74347.1 hypothetical protein D7231_10700 [Streptomyces klenkii]
MAVPGEVVPSEEGEARTSSHAGTFASLQDAVDFVTQPPGQGSGEAGFSYRADGQVDVVYFH